MLATDSDYTKALYFRLIFKTQNLCKKSEPLQIVRNHNIYPSVAENHAFDLYRGSEDYCQHWLILDVTGLYFWCIPKYPVSKLEHKVMFRQVLSSIQHLSEAQALRAGGQHLSRKRVYLTLAPNKEIIRLIQRQGLSLQKDSSGLNPWVTDM